MAEERISKIVIRNGFVGDLPILNPSELGYAIDSHRLFIGNEELLVAIADGTTSTFNIPVSSNFPLPVSNLENPKFYIEGNEVSNFIVGGTTVTFSSPPPETGEITMRFNSEIAMVNSVSNPSVLIFGPTGSSFADLGFGFSYNVYDACYIDYTVALTDNTGSRMGRLRILVNAAMNTFKLYDEYDSATNDAPIDFDGRVLNGIFYLRIRNTASSPVTFKHTFNLWKM